MRLPRTWNYPKSLLQHLLRLGELADRCQHVCQSHPRALVVRVRAKGSLELLNAVAILPIGPVRRPQNPMCLRAIRDQLDRGSQVAERRP